MRGLGDTTQELNNPDVNQPKSNQIVTRLEKNIGIHFVFYTYWINQFLWNNLQKSINGPDCYDRTHIDSF